MNGRAAEQEYSGAADLARGGKPGQRQTSVPPLSGASARFVQAAAATLNIEIAVNEPLARHTTFRIGGPAELYAVANTLGQLEQLAELAVAHAIPYTVLGGGSNILVSDAGMRGLVIANQTREWHWAVEATVATDAPDGGRILVVQSGVLLAGLARWTIKNGWGGLEWAVSVPGTVGGAVIGNAGAHGGDMAGVVTWAQVAYLGQERQRLTAADLTYTYRSSRLKEQLRSTPQPILLETGLRLTPGDATEMTARAEGYLNKRRASQPAEPSAGSIFRNPPGDYAGRLIEAAGLKGYRLGGAQISPRHANFIINTGDATAAEVVALLNLVRQRIYNMDGLTLQPEILFVGNWDVEPLCKM